MRRIAHDAAAAGDWVTPQLRIPAGADPLKTIASAILKLADEAGLAASREQRITDALGRVQAVALSGISLTLRQLDGPEPYTVLTALLIEVGRAAIARNVMVLIHVDEVQNITDENALSQLLIAVYLTGLSDFADTAGARVGAIFARRFKTTTLTAIADQDLASAVQPFVIEGWPVADDLGGISRIRMDAEASRRSQRSTEASRSRCSWPVSKPGTPEPATSSRDRRSWPAGKPPAPRLSPTSNGSLSGSPSAKEMSYEKATDAGPTSQRLHSVRGIIERGKPYTFRHRAVEAYRTSDWPDVDRRIRRRCDESFAARSGGRCDPVARAPSAGMPPRSWCPSPVMPASPRSLERTNRWRRRHRRTLPTLPHR